MPALNFTSVSSILSVFFQGDRYALLLLVPRTRDGLIRLIADLPAVPLTEIQERLREEELQISLPTFTVDTTTKPVSTLAKVRNLLSICSLYFHSFWYQ